jgi:hypothetical protein
MNFGTSSTHKNWRVGSSILNPLGACGTPKKSINLGGSENGGWKQSRRPLTQPWKPRNTRHLNFDHKHAFIYWLR